MKNSTQKTLYVVCDKWYQVFDKVNFTKENRDQKYFHGFFPFLKFKDAHEYKDELSESAFVYRVVVKLPSYDDLLSKVFENEVYERSEIEEELFDQEVEIITRYEPDFVLDNQQAQKESCCNKVSVPSEND